MWLGGADHESLAALNKAIDGGVNLIDTAMAYGDGHSEKLVGRVIRERKERVYIATKVPPKNLLWPARPGIGIEEVFPYDYIIECTEQSLRNLHMESVDLQQLHVWNPSWIERDEWRRALEDLKKSGKVRFVGISINDHQPDSALDIIKTGLIDTVQVIYNIFDQSPEANLFPLVLEKNIGVLARVPLDEGALTGRIDENTRFEPNDFRSRYFRDNRKTQVVERVTALQGDLDVSDDALPEVALRFCLSHPAVSTVIPGMRSARHVEANCTASMKGPLPEHVRSILKKHAWEKNFYA